MTVIILIAALLLPTLGKAKQSARQIACANNLKQINLAIRFYTDDWSGSWPVLPDPNPYPNGVGAYYKQLVKGYLGLSGPASPNEKAFICPSDPNEWTNITHAFTSYTFNGYEVAPGAIPRITGQALGSIKSPAKAVLAGEWPAFWGGSWHPLVIGDYPNAGDVLSFVDAHVAFTRVYWDGIPGSQPGSYEPPSEYDYSWNGE
jgi:type II secretory pathway pseudopilin PulG